MPIVNIPPIVNDQGNINVHKDEGCQIPIVLQDEDGNEQDASSIPLFFVCGAFEKSLDANPDDAFGRVIILTPDDLIYISNGATFRISDRSNSLIPVNRWEGRIYKRG